jgi:hypothetical protein
MIQELKKAFEIEIYIDASFLAHPDKNATLEGRSARLLLFHVLPTYRKRKVLGRCHGRTS